MDKTRAGEMNFRARIIFICIMLLLLGVTGVLKGMELMTASPYKLPTIQGI